MVYRHPAAGLIVPSVVHWKVGHYAAVIERRHDRILIQDYTFPVSLWISEKALNEDPSDAGYLLGVRRVWLLSLPRAPGLRRELEGDLALPPDARGIVVFAHGSGSSHQSTRNRAVAEHLRGTGLFGTLLFDLLTESESADRERVFDIPLLTRRLLAAIHWAADEPTTMRLPVGLFGASTGAAAARRVWQRVSILFRLATFAAEPTAIPRSTARN